MEEETNRVTKIGETSVIFFVGVMPPQVILKMSMGIENTIFRMKSNNKVRWMKKYRVGDEIVEFMIDTSSNVNYSPFEYIKKLKISLNNRCNNFEVYD